MNKWLTIVVALLFASLTVSVSAQDAEWELNQTLEVSMENLEFDFAYPDGWLTAQQELTTIINELEADHQQAFGDSFATRGYSISLRFQTVAELREKGITGASTLEDLLLVNSDTYGYQEPTEVSETTFLTWPALHVRTADAMGNEIIAIQGFYIGTIRGFLLVLAGPSADALDAFLPTWDAMLDSVVIDKAQVNLDGRRLYLECEGSGSPVVVFEPNVSSEFQHWQPILNTVAEVTRACLHARYTSRDELLTIQDDVNDTHMLLNIVGIKGPYVLVGAGVSGYTTRVFASNYSDEVGGMILIDSFHPDQFKFAVESNFRSTTWESVFSEWISWGLEYEASIEQVTAVDSLGDIPLVVLVAGSRGEFTTEFHRIWIEEWSRELAGLSTNSTLIVEDGVSHSAGPQYHPGVIDAIRQMVEEVRAQEE